MTRNIERWRDINERAEYAGVRKREFYLILACAVIFGVALTYHLATL